MLPRAGTDPNETAAQLRARLVQLQNIPAAGNHPNNLMGSYVEWVGVMERFLLEKFTEVPVERLHTARFWRINAFEAARPWDLVREEVEAQRVWLERLATELERMTELFDTPRAPIAVPDTHVLLHYKPLSDIDWCMALGESPVRLVIPLRVVDELDEKKFARRGELVDRARSVIRQLSRYVSAPGELRAGVHLTLVGSLDLDPLAHRHPRPPADIEILESCEALGAYNSRWGGAHFVSGDLGMQIRAADRPISVKQLSDEYLLPRETEARR